VDDVLKNEYKTDVEIDLDPASQFVVKRIHELYKDSTVMPKQGVQALLEEIKKLIRYFRLEFLEPP